MAERTNLILGIDESPKKWWQWPIYGLQHTLAMFVANSLIAILVYSAYGINMVPAALVSSGIGTILYLLITKFRSPVFLGSSAALMPVITTCLALGATEHGNFIALIIGLIVVGIVDLIIALLIKFIGVDWIHKLLPKVIVGPVIILIGLGLAGFATDWSMHNGGVEYNIVSVTVASITMLVICLVSHYAKGIWKTLPFLIGILIGYAIACGFTGIGIATNTELLKLVDFSVFEGPIEWIPTFSFMKAADGVAANGFEWTQLVTILLVAVPITFVSMCEHIGDHLNLSNIVGRDLLTDPGLHRTMAADGVATAVCGAIGGLDTTTYGENIAVIGVTKVACSKLILVAALFSIILGFCGPLMMFIKSIPYAVFGGAALVLYGFIAMSGIKSLKEIDLDKSKNTLIVSVVLIAGIGGLTLNFMLGDVAFTFTSTALAMIIGIILNVVLKDVSVKNSASYEDEFSCQDREK